MAKTLLCRVATTWNEDGTLDETAFREHLQRIIDADLGLYLASGGIEGYAMTPEELRRVYEIGVDQSAGRVFVGANLEEEHTATATIARARIAMAAEVDVINIYGPAGWHGYVPTDEEYIAFFDDVLTEIGHAVALCPNQILGYAPGPETIAEIVGRHGQVVAVNLTGVPDDIYLVRLFDLLPRRVETYVTVQGSLNTLGMGATGLLGVEANLIPQTFRRYLDLYEAGDGHEIHTVYADLKRTIAYVSRWMGSNARWIKIAMQAFELPGWRGGLRPPYLMPDDAEIDRFAAGAIQLDVPEINALARAVGRPVPADAR
ncbi:MAG TPA: dihydrodipicolinate synthase family protein [Acidimicrobiales bacterium]